MSAETFTHDVFLSHSAKDKEVVRPSHSLSASTGERARVRCRNPHSAKRLRKDGLKVWFDEWEFPVAASRQSAAFSSGGQTREEEDGGALPTRRYAETIEEGLEHSRVLVLCMSAIAFGSDWAQLEADTCGRGNLPFRDPLNKERRFLPLQLDHAPIKGSLTQFHFINWFPATASKRSLSTNLRRRLQTPVAAAHGDG